VIAPGLGPVGAGIAFFAIGGVLVGRGSDLGGLACDLVGAVLIWSAFRARNE
jgi:hypothetical protein